MLTIQRADQQVGLQTDTSLKLKFIRAFNVQTTPNKKLEAGIRLN
jgi:hypothetical protein